MRLTRRARLSAIEAHLEESRLHLNFGKDMHAAEWRIRRTVQKISSAGLLGCPETAELQVVAEASLLLGRALRLRGSNGEASAWIQRGAEMFGYLLRTSAFPVLAADRLSESLNALTLIRLDTYVPDANSEAGVRQALNIQQDLYDSNVRFSNRTDAYLEVTQRTAEAIQKTQRSASASDFLRVTRFHEAASQMGDHNRALRLLFIAKVASCEGDLQAASQALTQVENLPVVTKSNFVRIMYLESLASFLTHAEPTQVQPVLQEARRIRRLERVNEQGN